VLVGDIGVYRDEWMRRTGPFYPLVVAVKMQTRLPVAANLEPSEEDRGRARPWLPVVGALSGAALAVIAAVLLHASLAPIVVASLVVACGVLMTGAWFEIGLGRAIDRGAGRDGARGDSGATTFTLALVVLILVRVGCLTGLELAMWTGALIASQVSGRFAVLLTAKLGALVGQESEHAAGEDAGPGWIPVAVITAAAALLLALVGRGPGLLALILAAITAFLAARLSRHSRGARPERDLAAAAGAIAEIAALLCFAATSPA
jgi:cobalamin synthase